MDCKNLEMFFTSREDEAAANTRETSTRHDFADDTPELLSDGVGDD